MRQGWINSIGGERRHYVNDLLHREDGPACIVKNGNGEVIYNAYYINDKWHREDGFAREWFNFDGSVTGMYYICDEYLDSNKFLIYKLNKLLT